MNELNQQPSNSVTDFHQDEGWPWILVVDDEPATLFGFKKSFQRSNFNVDTAETVDGAKRFITEKNYSFVITDLKLSGSNGESGLEIVRFVKQKMPHTKVIMITGFGTPEIMTKAVELGVSYYFEKPVSAESLKLVMGGRFSE